MERRENHGDIIIITLSTGLQVVISHKTLNNALRSIWLLLKWGWHDPLDSYLENDRNLQIASNYVSLP